MTHKLIAVLFLVVLVFQGCRQKEKELAQQILNDQRLDSIYSMATDILKKGFNAGDGYPQVWIRDMNTFLETSMKVYSRDTIRTNLLTFLRLQQPNGEIVDGFVLKGRNTWHDPMIYTNPDYDAHIGFKNTVETDQETSLIQAFYKYIQASGDRGILSEKIGGQTALQHLERSVEYLLKNRFSEKFGLLTGATTQDWGDVQIEGGQVVDVDSLTHWTVDIYDNAMFVIAMDNMATFYANSNEAARWTKLKEDFSANIRKYLWDSKNQKFIPHLFLDGSPFPKDFNENEIYYHGGTAVAIEAGLLSRKEVKGANEKMLQNVKESGAPSIGMTMYPVYPLEIYPGNETCKPYIYQNGGDWDWFGGRMIQQLVRFGYVNEAYKELIPMVDRALKNKGFYEWYTRDNKPNGSPAFKGSAGVLAKAIVDLKTWAEEHK